MINVDEHLGLVTFVIKKYFLNKAKIRRYEISDLQQVGYIGLIKSCKTFNASLGTEFSTYAVPKIWGEISRYFREDKWYLGNREDRLKGKAKTPISMYAHVNRNQDICVGDMLKTDDFTDEVETEVYIKQLLMQLDTVERKVIEGLFFKGKLQRELAEEFDAPQCEISKIKKKAIGKMKQVALQNELVS
ncbi:sigma-70 family RNA polymerase sigma factor [Hathewaya histolytica]|uniref:sigma-70 family RNA polymerase sigma factor n=1 Tax=Hathewaya histolytica TaxID=1498 RepID=UPI003B673549